MRNIIISGGELFNKGAQAMTFVTVSELKKRFPDHRIILLSEMDKRRTKEEKDIYAFDFMGWYPIKFARAQKNPLLKLLCKFKNREEYKESYDIYSNTDMMVDISGYAISPKFSENALSVFADTLEFANLFDIPIYILPQSFGPFNFEGKKKEIDIRIAKYINKAQIVCAREEKGYYDIKQHYGLNNLILLDDIVLNNKSINLEMIYKNKLEDKLPEILPKSVAVIPNENTFDISKNDLFHLYASIVNVLLDNNYKVYIFSHSTTDSKICKEIFEQCKKEDSVYLISEEYNCIEYSKIVSNFDFLVASRFHSIVHAYKKNVPCISLGWADKYDVLLSKFNQDKYSFDVRNEINVNELIESVNEMIRNLSNEKIIIKKHLDIMQKENIFDIVFNGVVL